MMTYQIKRSYVQFVGNLVGFIIYGVYLFNNIKDNTISISEFGKYVLLLIPTLIIVQFIVKLLFDLINRTHEKNEAPKTMDEYDYLIELKAVRNFCFAFLGAFFLVLLLLWLEVGLLTCLFVMIGGIFIAGNTIELSYIIYYKEGA
jgi:protein-S-isoprenylcysteine O-methyltransferase Ste14